MNEIKQLLGEKYLKMEDYYNISFDVLKKIFKQNKMLIIIFILINMSIKIITEKYQGFLKTLEMMENSNLTEIKNYWYSINAIIVLSIVSIIVSMIILKKTGAVIEEEKGKYVLETVLKSFKLFCTTFAFLLIFYVVMVCDFYDLFFCIGYRKNYFIQYEKYINH